MRVHMFPDAKDQLLRLPGVAAELGKKAEAVRSRVRAPGRMLLATRSGVGPRGAYSQVMMRGQGALTVEFGSRSRPPQAPLRSALRGVR